MTILAATRPGLAAALRLAVGRPLAALTLADDLATTVKSFWAMALCLPLVVGRVFLLWADIGTPDDAWQGIARELAIFVVGWLIFVELTHVFTGATGRQKLWRRFLVVWNWCNVIEGVMVVAGGIPGLLGALDLIAETAQVVMLGWALWLEWYAARVTLAIGGLAAAGLVMMDQAIGLMLGSLALSLVG